eukprot:SAG11_NODE_9680_length_890_cov_1.279393_1_plen_224_part_00
MRGVRACVRARVVRVCMPAAAPARVHVRVHLPARGGPHPPALFARRAGGLTRRRRRRLQGVPLLWTMLCVFICFKCNLIPVVRGGPAPARTRSAAAASRWTLPHVQHIGSGQSRRRPRLSRRGRPRRGRREAAGPPRWGDLAFLPLWPSLPCPCPSLFLWPSLPALTLPSLASPEPYASRPSDARVTDAPPPPPKCKRCCWTYCCFGLRIAETAQKRKKQARI